jgi:PAS domain S-box-containing protein
MSKPIKILVVEDNPADSEMAIILLRAGGFEPEWLRVETEEAFLENLKPGLDLVLSDFSMPRFNGLRALELLKRSGLEVPFILISGTIGEETAVSAMKNGAADYFMKDRLTRLCSSVTHALEESRLRRERLQLEKLTQRRLAELRVLFDIMPAMIWFKDRDNRILMVNQRVADAAGKSVMEMEGKTSAEIYPLEWERFDAAERTVMESGEPQLGIVENVRVQAGTGIWVQTDRVPVRDAAGRTIGIVIMAQDITARRAAEDAMSELLLRTARRERLLNTALSSMSDFAQIYDREGKILYANQALLNLWGLTMEQVADKDFFDLGYPSALAGKLREQIKAVIAERKSITDETSYTNPAGSLGFYEYILSPVFAADGEVEFVVGSTRDITERKRTEESLRSGEAKLGAAQRIAHMGSWELDLANPLDPDSNALRWSDEMYRIAGFEPNGVEVTNEMFFKMVPQDDHKAIRTAVSQLIRDFKSYTIVHRLIRPDGEVRVVKETGEVLRDANNGRPLRVVGIAHDITERMRLEEQIRQSQKMDAIGTLAGGIAHDFNNILTAINGYTELAQLRITGNPEVKEFLSAVLRAGHRATDLVRQILTFSREQPLERRPIKLLPIATETVKLLRATIPSTIEIVLSLAKDAPTVLADATQVHQILMNLGTNASHAMKDRPGRLTVKLERFVVNHEMASRSPKLQPGVYARLSVGDTGCGMDQQTLQRIFEPFFTTKARTEGTGLGLAVVHGIMDNHDGEITVDSQPGVGTVFHAYFPSYAGEATAVEAESGAPPKGNNEAILVVDDEELLAKLEKEALSQMGYTVEYVTRPSEALELVRSDPQRFELVITDQTMPGMTGLLLATELQRIRPGMPVILTTGYSASLTPERVNAAGICLLLIKPPTLHALATAVRTALDGRSFTEGPDFLPPSAPAAPCLVGT